METINLTQNGQTLYNKQADQLMCPVCGVAVDYLLGDDIDGGRRGCELCWRPSLKSAQASRPVPLPGQSLPVQGNPSPVAAEPPVPTPPIITPNTPPTPPPAPEPESVTPPVITGTRAVPNPLGLDLNEIPANQENPAFTDLMSKLRSEVKK